MSNDESKPVLTIAGEMIEKNKDYQLYREIELALRDSYNKMIRERDRREKEVHSATYEEATEMIDHVRRFVDFCIERQREIERYYVEKARNMRKEKEK